jgi:hypothetical protein
VHTSRDTVAEGGHARIGDIAGLAVIHAMPTASRSKKQL